MKNLTWYLGYALTCTAATAKVISVPISRGHGSHSDAHVTKRSFVQSDAVMLPNTDSSFYYTNVTIGSPPQAIALLIDTGSSDIWFPSRKLTQLSGVSDARIRLGVFDETRSSTYRTLPSNFSATFQDGLGVTGTYLTDSLSIGGTSVDALTMALATNGSLANKVANNPLITNIATGFNGIMGLGSSLAQSNTSGCLPDTPDNCTSLRECDKLWVAPCVRPGLLDLLVQQKVIATRAYSLYLDRFGTNTGNILFGGIDTAKFEPPLVRIPVNAQDIVFAINLTSVSASPATYSRRETVNFQMPNSTIPVLLDSGSSFITLPEPLTAKLQAYAGAYLHPGIDNTLISCEQSKNKSTISFGLGGPGGPVISIPISELVTPISFVNGSQLGTKGREVCQFAISSYSQDIDVAGNLYIVGNVFLRSAYAVYNLDDWSISLAQARFNTTHTNIKEIMLNETGSYRTSALHY